MRHATVAALALWAHTLNADELVLKDGRSVEFRVLKDNGDTVEVQTVEAKTLTIAKKDIKEVKLVIPKAPLTGATFTGDLTKGGAPVNLLALIKPKEHGTIGEWRFAGGALVGKNGFLEVPHIPSGSYDVDLVVERKDAINEFNIGLVAAGMPFAVTFDWGRGECSGLSAIDGRRIYENESRKNGKVILERKPTKITCAVRLDCIVVLVDGKEFLNWKGDPKRLSKENRPVTNQNLFIGIYESTFAISQYVVTPRN